MDDFKPIPLIQLLSPNTFRNVTLNYRIAFNASFYIYKFIFIVVITRVCGILEDLQLVIAVMANRR